VAAGPPKYRPALTALEDRNAPGDILSGVLAAAIGGALLNPLEQVTAWVGSPSADIPLWDIDQPTKVSIRAGACPSPDDVPLPPQFELAVPERDVVSLSPAEQSVVAVGMGFDDEFLFAPAVPYALRPPLDGQPRTQPTPPGDGGSSGVSVGAATPPVSSGEVVGVAGRNDDALLIVRPQSSTERASKSSDIAVQTLAETTLDSSQIVNSAPTVGADSGSWLTTSEDTPLTFSIGKLLENDTDPDGDVLFLANWQMDLSYGLLEQISGTEMRFTPSEDFHGTQEFEYTVSDGIAKATGTATISVTSVNDVPVAFNDAYRFTHGAPPYPYYFMPISYTAVDTHAVIDNDTDPDGLPAPNVQVDTTGLVGTITMNPAGVFSWSGPGLFYGETSFKYRTCDSDGAWANWATVRLFALSADPGEGGVSAEADVFPVGIEAQTLNVRDNDGVTGGYAVLTSRPAAQRVRSFDFSGELKYTPTTPADFSFTYRVFSETGAVSLNTNVQMTRPTLEIFHGGVPADAKAVDIEKSRVKTDKAKVNVGAFTVVNQNDTDGDGRRDYEDKWVNSKSSPAPGHAKVVGGNEIDLMRLRVYRPAGAFPGNLVLSVPSGAAKIYNQYDKGNEEPIAKVGLSKNLTAADFPAPVEGTPSFKEFWVEVFDPADSMQTITIRAQYGNASDDVKATGIWSTMTGFRTEGGLSVQNDGGRIRSNFAFHGGKLGLLTMGEPNVALINASRMTKEAKAEALAGYHTRNAGEMEFTVTPVDVYRVSPVVQFDVTRSADALVQLGKLTAPLRPPNLLPLPEYLDQSNDDTYGGGDNDNDLFSGPLFFITGNGYHNRLYSFDGPGRELEPWVKYRYSRYQHWLKAWEFVRVKIATGGFDATAAVVKGSRASEYGNWHSWIDADSVPDAKNNTNTIWDRPAARADRNEIKRDFGQHPNLPFQE
jgi:hypothetical protein